MSRDRSPPAPADLLSERPGIGGPAKFLGELVIDFARSYSYAAMVGAKRSTRRLELAPRTGRGSASAPPGGYVTADPREITFPQSLRLRGKTALVAVSPGASASAAIALALARAGADLALIGGTSAELQEVTDALRNQPVRVQSYTCVLTDPEEIARAFSSAFSFFTRIDTLVWITDALAFTAPYSSVAPSIYAERSEQSLVGLMSACRQFVDLMLAGPTGSMIVVTSPPRARPWPGITASLGRQIVVEVVRGIATQCEKNGTRINVVSSEPSGDPHLVAHDSDQGVDNVELATELDPFSRLAAAVVWLASEDANGPSGKHFQVGRHSDFPPGQLWQHRLNQLLSHISVQLPDDTQTRSMSVLSLHGSERSSPPCNSVQQAYSEPFRATRNDKQGATANTSR